MISWNADRGGPREVGLVCAGGCVVAICGFSFLTRHASIVRQHQEEYQETAVELERVVILAVLIVCFADSYCAVSVTGK